MLGVMFYSVRIFRTSHLRGNISHNREIILQGGEWGEPVYTEILQQRAGSLNIKRLLLIQVNQISLKNLAPFYVWEDTRVSVQFSLVAQSCPTLCDSMSHSTPGLPVHHQIPESTQTHVHWVGDAIHFIFCHPLLLLPSIFPNIRVFSSESALHIRWPKY